MIFSDTDKAGHSLFPIRLTGCGRLCTLVFANRKDRKEKDRGVTLLSRFTKLTCALVLLAGCQTGGIGRPGSPAWQLSATPDDKNRYYTQECISYGFALGTPQMAQCKMQIAQNLRDGARERMQTLSDNSRPRPTITCRTFGNTTTCS